MEDLPTPYRRATPDDAPALADLVDIAGEGLPSHPWAQMAEEGETAVHVGRRRARREAGSFSYRKAVVADPGPGVEAALAGYPSPDAPEPIPDDLPAMFVPMQELENLACGTSYVNVLATYPECRGHGHGSRLPRIAQPLAMAAECRGPSIIVADTNLGAWRLYERSGFRPMASRRMLKEGGAGPGENFLLLIQEATT